MKTKIKKTKIKKLKTKLLKVPKILVSNSPAKEVGSFPVDHYSYSFMANMCNNPITAKIKYINKDVFETTTGATGILGKAFHKGMEVYYGGADDVVITNENEAITYGLKAIECFINDYNDGFIEYSTTIPNKAKLLELAVFCFNSYIKEVPYQDNVITTEEKIKGVINEIEWKGKRLSLIIPLKGQIDRIERTKKGLTIVDYKTCKSFSELDKIDGKKIVQSIINFFLVYIRYGEIPYSFCYDEVKYTENKQCKEISKGCPKKHDSQGKHFQVERYEIVYAEYDLYFDFFFRLYDDISRMLNGEMRFLPNLDTYFDNEVSILAYIHRLDESEEVAKLMKENKVENLTDLLKKEIQNAGKMRNLLSVIENKFATAKSIDYTKMQIEEKIKTKLLEYGISITYESKISGNTVDLYQFTPSFGLKMSKLKSYLEDIEQVLAVSGIRVLAPIPNTSLIGFEVPKKDRIYPVYKKSGKDLVIGLDSLNKEIKLIIEEMPHLLVAGTTGSGKSVFLRQAINQLSKDYEVDIIDPKGIEFEDGLSDHFAIASYFQSLLILMEERYKEMKKQKVKKWNQLNKKSKIVIIDEYNDLYMSKEKIVVGYKEVIKVYKKVTQKIQVPVYDTIGNVVDTAVKKLAQKSRSAGIHLILATQRPSIKVLDGDIKANFVCRVCFQLPSKTDSNVVLDQEGAEKLQGFGDGLLLKNGIITRFQSFNI